MTVSQSKHVLFRQGPDSRLSPTRACQPLLGSPGLGPRAQSLSGCREASLLSWGVASRFPLHDGRGPGGEWLGSPSAWGSGGAQPGSSHQQLVGLSQVIWGSSSFQLPGPKSQESAWTLPLTVASKPSANTFNFTFKIQEVSDDHLLAGNSAAMVGEASTPTGPSSFVKNRSPSLGSLLLSQAVQSCQSGSGDAVKERDRSCLSLAQSSQRLLLR